MMKMNLQIFGGRGSSGGKRSGGGGTPSAENTRAIHGKEYTVGESVGFRETERRIMLDNGDRIVPNGYHVLDRERQTKDSSIAVYESQKGNLYEVSYSVQEYTSGVITRVTSVRKVIDRGDL